MHYGETECYTDSIGHKQRQNMICDRYMILVENIYITTSKNLSPNRASLSVLGYLHNFLNLYFLSFYFMTPEQKADEIIANLNDRSLNIDCLDDDIVEEIRQEIIDTINK